ncbi:GMC oxidoreductase [Erythrobacter donghaensis]|uniref:GMC oxidoreductase n=1 Tax=Erythrobacter donghaensis TaxID=267135 RepID=UPI000A36182D|nr:GMC family oxidoreductase [Erythrobacter donghaensis]
MAEALTEVKQLPARVSIITHDQPFDLVMIGAGMGGSIAAARCAAAGARVLVLEAGHGPVAALRPRGLMARLRAAPVDDGERWPTQLIMRRREGARAVEVNAVLGMGPGGSGRIYGAALGRARRWDFETDNQPHQWDAGGETALPNAWPVAYDDFLTAYREAERLLAPVGTRDPTDPDDDADLAPPPPLSPAHEAIVARLQANGRHPFRMHVGIAYRPGCSECQGSTCLRDCKAHGFNRALAPALAAGAPVTLQRGAMVRRLRRLPEGWAVDYVAASGEETSVTARAVVLAGGALNSPRVLQASGELWGGAVPDLIGRGLMFHASEIFAVAAPEGHSLHGPRKVIAMRDHYASGAMPLAECQSLGMVGKAGMITSFLNDKLRQIGIDAGVAGRVLLRPVGAVAERIFARSELFTAALQDLPYADNRVTTEVDAEGVERIAVTYRPRGELIARARHFRGLMREAFSPLNVRFLTAPGEPNLGHPMGTCRMGHDPESSVVDGFGEVWGQPGLFVADASVFPSSLGINPALTVAAHAIRVSARVGERLAL